MGGALTQAGYAMHQRHSPEQRVLQHMLDRETYDLCVRPALPTEFQHDRFAVVAVSDRFAPSEVVNVHRRSKP